MNAKKDDWEEEFQRWKTKKNDKVGKIAERLEPEFKEIWEEKRSSEKKPAEKKIVEIESEEKPSEKRAEHLKEPKHIKKAKLVFLLIPLLILGYLVYANFIANQEFYYFYDI